MKRSAGQGTTDGAIPLRVRIGVVADADATVSQPLDGCVTDVVAHVRGMVFDRAPSGFDVDIVAVSLLRNSVERGVARFVHEKLDGGIEPVLGAPVRVLARELRSGDDAEEFELLIAAATHAPFVAASHTDDDPEQVALDELIDRCDILLAIWNGKPSSIALDAADTVDKALRRGVPVVRADPATCTVRVQRSIDESDEAYDDDLVLTDAALTPRAIDALDRYNKSIPRRVTDDDDSGEAGEIPNDLRHLARVVDWLRPYSSAAESAARRFQHLYWTCAALTWTLGAVALVTAGAHAVYFSTNRWIVAFELVTLVAILGIVTFGNRRRLREHWIQARFLSERLRSALFLAAIGADLPVREADSPPWIARAYSEVWIGRPRVRVDPNQLESLRVFLVKKWIQPQAEYHTQRRWVYAMRERRIRRLTFFFFIGALLAAVAHLVAYAIDAHRFAKAMEFLAIALPACAAAVHGYAGQRDYRQHCERHARTAQRLGLAAGQPVTELDDLVELASGVERLTREERGAWFGAVRLHDLEVPS